VDGKTVTLGLADAKVGAYPPKDQAPAPEVRVERRDDPQGAYVLVTVTPKPGTPAWTAVEVAVPQRFFDQRVESVELEAWNPSGVPITIVADACILPDKLCFEIGFCRDHTPWQQGWQKLHVPLQGKDRNPLGEKEVEIKPPLRLKYLLLIMRQGKPYEIGLRRLTAQVE